MAKRKFLRMSKHVFEKMDSNGVKVKKEKIEVCTLEDVVSDMHACNCTCSGGVDVQGEEWRAIRCRGH